MVSENSSLPGIGREGSLLEVDTGDEVLLRLAVVARVHGDLPQGEEHLRQVGRDLLHK